ncbi:hypothetical protein G7Y89_g4576 [Cudoniella acicularis]|uniref:Uncharacterized protein n=1 Tax=Cudoniella acicularis TaxID=354080 RepID=A0A8H4RP66_9HELO|nr:hypothetical protein G7Y89_g4576 [Cudoniella acicularis]
MNKMLLAPVIDGHGHGIMSFLLTPVCSFNNQEKLLVVHLLTVSSSLPDLPHVKASSCRFSLSNPRDSQICASPVALKSGSPSSTTHICMLLGYALAASSHNPNGTQHRPRRIIPRGFPRDPQGSPGSSAPSPLRSCTPAASRPKPLCVRIISLAEAGNVSPCPQGSLACIALRGVAVCTMPQTPAPHQRVAGQSPYPNVVALLHIATESAEGRPTTSGYRASKPGEKQKKGTITISGPSPTRGRRIFEQGAAVQTNKRISFETRLGTDKDFGFGGTSRWKDTRDYG